MCYVLIIKERGKLNLIAGTLGHSPLSPLFITAAYDLYDKSLQVIRRYNHNRHSLLFSYLSPPVQQTSLSVRWPRFVWTLEMVGLDKTRLQLISFRPQRASDLMRQFATNPSSCNYKMLFIKLSFNLNLLPNLGSVTEWRTNGHTCVLGRGQTEDLREGNLIFTFLHRRSRGDTHYNVFSSNVLPTSNLPGRPWPDPESGSKPGTPGRWRGSPHQLV